MNVSRTVFALLRRSPALQFASGKRGSFAVSAVHRQAGTVNVGTPALAPQEDTVVSAGCTFVSGGFAFDGSCWVIIGPPGSGKGTYAKLLAKRFNLDHFSTGDLAREKLTDASLRKLMDDGQLLPDSMIFKLLIERLGDVPQKASGVLLDGFPRTLAQAEMLKQILPVQLALEIQLNDKHILAKTLGRRTCSDCGAGYNVADVHDDVEQVYMPKILSASGPDRCQCGGCLVQRKDDAPHVAQARLDAHHRSFDPILAVYRAQGLLLQHRVKYGVGDMDELYQRIDGWRKTREGNRNIVADWSIEHSKSSVTINNFSVAKALGSFTAEMPGGVA